jgi:hypothetical protein
VPHFQPLLLSKYFLGQLGAGISCFDYVNLQVLLDVLLGFVVPQTAANAAASSLSVHCQPINTDTLNPKL